MMKYLLALILFFALSTTSFAQEYYLVGQTTVPIRVFMEGSASGDTNVISIYRHNAGSPDQLDFSDTTWGGTITTPTAALTWIGDGWWYYTFDIDGSTGENAEDIYMWYANNSTRGQIRSGQLVEGGFARAFPDALADAAGGLPISDAGGLDLDAMNTNINDIETDTSEIGTAGAGLTNIDLPNQTMDITGNLSGSVGSVTGAVGSVTGAVGSVQGGTTAGAAAASLDGGIDRRDRPVSG